MSVLSEKLSYFTEQKDQNIADLAKRSGIERSTLYQYLKGKRPLQNRAQLEALMSELHLTPDERTEVMEAYELARVGVKIYNRRRKVREILGSLLTVESGSFEETGTEPDSYFCIENQNHFIKGTGGQSAHKSDYSGSNDPGRRNQTSHSAGLQSADGVSDADRECT